MTGHAEVVHGHENRVGADKTKPEVQASQSFAHHASEHFWKPVIGCGENAEDRRDTHDQVKVTRYEIGVVQLDVEHGLRQEGPADSAGNEQGNKSDGKQHGRLKA